MTEPVDLDAYLARIGVPRAGLAPDFPSLVKLASHHAAAIPFESLNPFLGLPVPLATPLIERKLVHEGRGGYCFEQNRLFAAVLTGLGFELSYLIARVTWGQPDDAVTPRSHMVLRVELDGVSHIADVGFGGLTLTGALRLVPDIEQPTPHEPFRLLQAAGDWRVQAKLRGEWKTLYRFDLTPQWLIDYESPNHFTATHPSSRFVNYLIAARSLPDRRLALFDREFAVHTLDGVTRRRTLADTDGLLAVLRDEFGLRLPVGEAATRLHERLDALPSSQEQPQEHPQERQPESTR